MGVRLRWPRGHTHRVLVLVVLHVNTVDLAQNRELVARVRQLVQQPLDEVCELGTPYDIDGVELALSLLSPDKQSHTHTIARNHGMFFALRYTLRCRSVDLSQRYHGTRRMTFNHWHGSQL